jgi:hypothetical protein
VTVRPPSTRIGVAQAQQVRGGPGAARIRVATFVPVMVSTGLSIVLEARRATGCAYRPNSPKQMRTISKAENIRARLDRARSSPVQAYRTHDG